MVPLSTATCVYYCEGEPPKNDEVTGWKSLEWEEGHVLVAQDGIRIRSIGQPLDFTLMRVVQDPNLAESSH